MESSCAPRAVSQVIADGSRENRCSIDLTVLGCIRNDRNRFSVETRDRTISELPLVRRPWMGPSFRSSGYVHLAQPRDLILQRRIIFEHSVAARFAARSDAWVWSGRGHIGGASMKRQLPLRSQHASCVMHGSGHTGATAHAERPAGGSRERKRILLWRNLQHHRPPSSL